MKLYYAPAVCSLSPHIVALEAGLKLDLVKVDIKTHKVEDGRDFYSINPKGYVPVLELDDGSLLTEGPAIVQYLGDQAGNPDIMPRAGTLERYRQQAWLNFVSTELHKGYGPLWKPNTPDEYKAIIKTGLATRFEYLSRHFADHTWLMGDTFTAADAYLFTILNWSKWVHVDLAPFSALGQFMERVMARPAVQQALKEEGLLK